VGLGGLNNGGALAGGEDVGGDPGIEPPHADINQKTGEAAHHLV